MSVCLWRVKHQYYSLCIVIKISKQWESHDFFAKNFKNTQAHPPPIKSHIVQCAFPYKASWLNQSSESRTELDNHVNFHNMNCKFIHVFKGKLFLTKKAKLAGKVQQNYIKLLSLIMQFILTCNNLREKFCLISG